MKPSVFGSLFLLFLLPLLPLLLMGCPELDDPKEGKLLGPCRSTAPVCDAAGFLTCNQGKCLGPADAFKPCEGDENCASGECDVTTGTCAGIACASDASCGSYSYCDTSLASPVCRADKNLGDACARPEECFSGECYAGECVDCFHDGHCPTSMFCDIPTGEVVGKCESLRSSGRECTVSTQCGSYTFVYPPNGSTLSGAMFCRDYQCVECAADVSCPYSYRCEGGSCVPDPSDPCRAFRSTVVPSVTQKLRLDTRASAYTYYRNQDDSNAVPLQQVWVDVTFGQAFKGKLTRPTSTMLVPAWGRINGNTGSDPWPMIRPEGGWLNVDVAAGKTVSMQFDHGTDPMVLELSNYSWCTATLPTVADAAGKAQLLGWGYGPRWTQ